MTVPIIGKNSGKEEPYQKPPSLPPERLFVVTRAHFALEQDKSQEELVSAHSMNLEGEGVISFSSFTLEDGAPIRHIRRMFNKYEWRDVRELEDAPSPSGKPN